MYTRNASLGYATIVIVAESECYGKKSYASALRRLSDRNDCREPVQQREGLPRRFIARKATYITTTIPVARERDTIVVAVSQLPDVKPGETLPIFIAT